jgi:ABC-type branched-subunit amino acid transport system ATPase component
MLMLGPASGMGSGARELIRIAQAVKSFGIPEGGRVHALDHVDLTIRNNEFLTLLGPPVAGRRRCCAPSPV